MSYQLGLFSSYPERITFKELPIGAYYGGSNWGINPNDLFVKHSASEYRGIISSGKLYFNPSAIFTIFIDYIEQPVCRFTASEAVAKMRAATLKCL